MPLVPRDLGIGALFDKIQEAVIAADVETGRIVLWNPAAEKIFGYSSLEAIGELIELIIPERLQATHRNGIARYRDTGHGPYIDFGELLELPARHRQGHELLIEMTLNPLETPVSGGTFVMAIIRDVSDRREASLLEAELAAIVVSSEDAIIGMTLDGQIRSWNKGAATIYGYSADEALGRHVSFIVPVDRAGEEGLLLGRIQASEAVEHYETKRRCRSGKVIDVALTVSPIIDRAGVIVGASSIARDISQQKNMEQQIQDSLEEERRVTAQLRRLDELKNVYLRAATHDLKTPLAAALLGSQALAMKLDRLSPEQMKDVAEKVTANLKEIDRLIGDLLDVDRLTRGALEPLRQATDLVGKTKEVTARSRCNVQMDLPTSLQADVDPTHFERILWNLLGNAEKHTPAGTKVRVRLEPTDDGVLLTVSDSGPGIAEDMRTKIFELFGRGQTHAFGTGVGLFLVSEFAKLHSGSAWVEESSDGGAAFKVLLKTT